MTNDREKVALEGTATDQHGYECVLCGHRPETATPPDFAMWVQMDMRLGLVRTKVLTALGSDVLGALDDAVLALIHEAVERR